MNSHGVTVEGANGPLVINKALKLVPLLWGSGSVSARFGPMPMCVAIKWHIPWLMNVLPRFCGANGCFCV